MKPLRSLSLLVGLSVGAWCALNWAPPERHLTLAESILAPVVFVEAGDMTGSATVIKVSGGKSYLLTAAHVASAGDCLEVTFWDDVHVPARALFVDEESDVALLEVDREWSYHATLGDAHILQRIYISGCPMGHHPAVPFGGEVIDTQDPRGFGMTSATMIPGASGGAVFGETPDGWRLLGIPSRIGTNHIPGLPFPSLCPQWNFYVPTETVRRVLEEANFGWVLE